MEIKKTNDQSHHRVTALIYGQSGVGKTTLASTLMGNTLVISAESGMLSLADHEIDYVEAKTVEDFRQVLMKLKEGSDYDNIFIDSLTEIGQIIVTELERQMPDRKDALKMWGEYAKQMRSFVKAFRDLAPYNVFLVALDKIEKDEIGRRFHVPDINGKIATQLAQFFDEAFYYTSIEGEDGEQKRVLVTSGSEKTIAKDRSGKLDRLEEPNLQNILNKIKGE